VIHKNLQQIEDMKAKAADTGVVLTAYQSEGTGENLLQEELKLLKAQPNVSR
jgi:hypothetical protein